MTYPPSEPGQLSQYGSWATGWPTNHGLISGRHKKSFLSLKRSNQAWGPPSLLSGY